MSYNTLHLPLDIGTWQCKLVPAREFYRLSGGYVDRFADWDARREREREIEDDKRTFDRHFRPNYDFRRTIARDIDAIRSFLSDQLNLVHWNLPSDNKGIERALKQAVRDGMLVPVINRDWRSHPSTFRPTPAPLRWPQQSGGGAFGRSGGTKWAAFENAGPGPLTWDGEPVLSGPYDPATWEKQLKAARAAMAASSGDDGGDLLGRVEGVAGSVFGSDSDADDDGDATPGMAESFADDVGTDDDTSTPLGDAQPFEYSDDTSSGDVQEIAARGVSAAEEAECDAMYKARMTYCSALSKMYGGDARTYLACKDQAFQDYQACRGY
ncbi:hypothetical protein VSR68_26115 [Paraburkholderia phymatum]|uniref:hypothetical protein n=1 Tax=Paraburkholderia phymatum TaxID=148447 RepID=UPI003170C253